MSSEFYLARSFIASQILGDGSFRNGSLDICHSDKYIDYLTWKQEIAQNCGLRVTGISQCAPLQTNVGVLQTRARFLVSGIPTQYKNVDPTDLVGDLTSLGLLLWWLDDGSMIVHEKRNGQSVARFGYLNTQAFDEITNKRLSDKVFDKFGLDLKVHVDRGSISDRNAVYHRLYFNASALRSLIDIVREHIASVPLSMRYKLNMQYRPNRLKSSDLFSRQYNF